MAKKKVAVVGGGTGTFTVLRGLKQYSKDIDITAIMTMADDGGSNKVLRDEFGLLPTSGIRQAVVALSSDEGLMRELFTYRYYQGKGISGMTFGNLFIAALADIMGSQEKAISETCELMDVVGQILPVSYDDIHLLAVYEGGVEVLGEHLIDEYNEEVGKKRIVDFRTVPEAKIDDKARVALEDADLIVLGPGDLYTNTVANLVVGGVSQAIVKSKARLVFVVNLMTKFGETYDYSASDFLEDLGKYLPGERLDYVLVNSDYSFEASIIKSYNKEHAEPVKDDLDMTHRNAKVIRAKLLSHSKIARQKGDSIKRNIVRHDSENLASIIVEILRDE